VSDPLGGPVVQRAANAEAVRELLGILDETEFRLSPFVVPIVEFIRAKPTRIDRDAIGFAIVTSAAAESSLIQLWNAAGSGIAIKPQFAIISTAIESLVSLRIFDTVLTDTVNAGIFRDRRNESVPVGQVTEQSNAALLGTRVGQVETVAVRTLKVDLGGFVLRPSQGIHLAMQTQQQRMFVTYYWSEADMRIT